MRNDDYHIKARNFARKSNEQARNSAHNLQQNPQQSNHHFSFLISHSSFFISHFAFLWCFFQFCYPYHFFYQEQNQIFLWSEDYVTAYFDKPGGLARLIGDFLTQFYYYLYAGAVILSLCIAVIGQLCYHAIRNFHICRGIALPTALAAMTFVAVCHFSTNYHLSSTISIMGWMLTLWLISCVKAKRAQQLILACCILLPAYLLFGHPHISRIQKPDLILEKNFAIDNEYHFGNHDKVIALVKNANGWNDQMLFFYNLVYAQRGELPDHLLDFTPNYLGTFDRIGPDTPRLTIINMNELYWLLGDMTFTERAAMMTNVFSPDNRNIRMIRRLAECCTVSGDHAAARKYLRILAKTFVYRPMLACFDKGQLPPLYAEKTKFVNHRDTITVSDNAHFLMMQLLDHHPDNTVALDYILCSDLLLKDITNFKRDYDRYCMANNKPRLKTLYQEALCIWLAGSNAPQEDWEKYILRQEVMKRFVEYNNQRGNPRFKGTYWYYFDKQKAPEVK